jgi:hypothetical protein
MKGLDDKTPSTSLLELQEYYLQTACTSACMQGESVGEVYRGKMPSVGLKFSHARGANIHTRLPRHRRISPALPDSRETAGASEIRLQVGVNELQA